MSALLIPVALGPLSSRNGASVSEELKNKCLLLFHFNSLKNHFIEQHTCKTRVRDVKS